jgi:hypothetical protein
MSATQNLARVYYCERLEQFDRLTLLRMGTDGTGLTPTSTETTGGLTAGDIAAQALQLALDGYVSFKFTARATTNDAVTLELIARGVSFAAGTTRRVEIYAHSVDDAGVAAYERRFIIEGGTTPTVLNFGENANAETTSLKGSAGSEVAFDATRTVATGTEAQTFALAAGASTLTFTYTGQSGDVTNAVVEIRVYPKSGLVYE